MKIYKEKTNDKTSLKKPMIDFRGKIMIAVNENGVGVAEIFDFGSMESFCSIRGALENFGYSTDWAEWGEEGQMIKLLECFE